MWYIVDYEQGGIAVCSGETEELAWDNLPGGINGSSIEAIFVDDVDKDCGD